MQQVRLSELYLYGSAQLHLVFGTVYQLPFEQHPVPTLFDDTSRLIFSPATPPSTNCYHPCLRFKPLFSHMARYKCRLLRPTYLLTYGCFEGYDETIADRPGARGRKHGSTSERIHVTRTDRLLRQVSVQRSLSVWTSWQITPLHRVVTSSWNWVLKLLFKVIVTTMWKFFHMMPEMSQHDMVECHQRGSGSGTGKSFTNL